jgi:hypothetical protein
MSVLFKIIHSFETWIENITKIKKESSVKCNNVFAGTPY